MSRLSLNAVIESHIDDLLVDEECGDLEEAPHLRLLLYRNGESLADELDQALDMDEEDLEFLREQAGAIVTQKQDGTCVIRYFASGDELEDRWQDAINDLDAAGEDEDEPDNEDSEDE